MARAGGPGVPRAWRQLAYHLLSLVMGLPGGVVVAFCWCGPLVVCDLSRCAARPAASVAVLAAVLLLVAPWAARAMARLDEVTARALLGPSHAQQLEHQVQTLARSRAEVVAAADAERRRIERDLHDGAQQQLVSLAMNLGIARAALDGLPPAARKAIERAHEEAIAALAGLRELVRGLHPAVLNDRGLDAALSGIVARAPLPVRLRDGLTRLLTDAGFEVIAAVADAGQLLRAVGDQQPDLAVIDVRMPPTHTDEGIQAALVIRRQYPQIAVLVLSQYVEESYATDLLSAHTSAVGYLLKDRIARVSDFLDALRRVADGGTVLDPEVVAQLMARRRSDPVDRLTPREQEVLL